MAKVLLLAKHSTIPEKGTGIVISLKDKSFKLRFCTFSPCIMAKVLLLAKHGAIPEKGKGMINKMEKPDVPAVKKNKKRLFEIISVLQKHNVKRNFSPEKLREILEDLGPTFVKFGQIMSMRADIIPARYCAELTKLRSDVAPMGFDEVCMVVKNSCGNTVEELFSSFDEKPLGSASIAQAHLASLKDGSKVVVKVQRTGIQNIMARDIVLLRRASIIMKLAGGISGVIDFSMVINELWNAAQEEMNFLTEAKNAQEFYDLNCDVAFVTCPHIYMDYTTEKVLVMEYIEGYSLNDKDLLIKSGYDLTEIGEKLADNYIKQIIEDGFFHADPHPGNIKIHEGKIVWIDMGMMGRLSSRDKKLLGKAVKAIAQHDISTIKDVVLIMGVSKNKGNLDHSKLYSDIDEMLSKYGALGLGNLNLTSVLTDVMYIAKKHEISMPGGVSMLARGISTIEGVVADISPETNIIEIAANRMSGNILFNINYEKELSELSGRALKSGRKALDIPVLVSDILNMSIKGQTKINIEHHSSVDLNRKINRIVDKLITGILVAAFLVGSSLICTTNMSPKILGIPALGVLGYVAAIVLCIWMFIDTVKNRR